MQIFGDNNTVGAAGDSGRNIISGNGQDGVRKSTALDGVFVSVNTSGTLIGGPGDNARNIISGNNRYGVSINRASTTIQNNRIGYKFSDPLAALPNTDGQVDPTGGLGTWTDNQILP